MSSSFGPPCAIRPATPVDWPAIWRLFREVVSAADAYVFDADTPESEAREIWMGSRSNVYVAEDDGQILGSSYIKPNQPGLGSHVCNAGFMVSKVARGRGIGRLLGEHAIEEARRLGYAAMQFNFVVSTNRPAVELWLSLGFRIVGTLPAAFRHPHFGLVDAHVMHRHLQ